MPLLLLILPLIVFLIVRAKMNQAEAQNPQNPQNPRPQAPQSAPARAQTVRPLRQSAAPVWTSPEGTASDEGECVEENPEHCAVEHEEEPAYALGEARVGLPRGELARAVVMSEILGKPVSLRGDRFW